MENYCCREAFAESAQIVKVVSLKDDEGRGRWKWILM